MLKPQTSSPPPIPSSCLLCFMLTHFHNHSDLPTLTPTPPPKIPTSPSLLWNVLKVQDQEDSGPGICSNDQRSGDPGSGRLAAFPLPSEGAQWP